MEAIFSCKLYKGSKRKADIRAALENPINQELVVQLKKYLDPDDLGELMKNQIAQEQENDQAATEAQAVEGDESKITSTPKQTVVQVSSIEHTGVAESLPATDADEDIDDHVTEIHDADEDTDPVEEEEVVDDVESATALAELDSSSQVSQLPSLDTVKGQLNAKDSTSGVVRTRNINDELWVYYDDKKNLNTLMGDVIESLQAAGFYNLEFNRLARTENAIVFQVSETSIVSEVKDA